MDRIDRYIRFSEWREKVCLHRYTSIGSFVESGLQRCESEVDEIVLIEDSLQESEMAETETELSQRTPIISFTKERIQSTTSEAIYMYQPISRMLRQMLDLAAVRTLTADHGEGRVSIDDEQHSARHRMATIAVTSPYGGSGVTTVSRLLAHQLAMRYGKVLYLNMELYPKRSPLPEVTHEFSRFLYMLTTRPDELVGTWTQYCGPLADKVFAFAPPKLRREMRDMKPEYINLIGEQFHEIGFQAIVIDLDAHWLDDLIEGHIHCDESWVVLPWKHRNMQEFPELLPYLQQPNVKLIANRTDAQEGTLSSMETKELEVDASLPYSVSALRQQEEVLADDRLSAMISRVIRESAALGGVADDG